MSFEVQSHPGYAVLTFHEDTLSFNVGPELKATVTNIAGSGVHNLIVDMSLVRFADSAGLSGLVAANRVFKNLGGRLILAGVNRQITRIMSLAQLETLLRIEADVAQAVAVLEGSSPE